MEKNQSIHRFISMGLVELNKKRNTNKAFITPIEIVPEIVDEIDGSEQTLKTKGIDPLSDTTYRVSISRGKGIWCDWYGDTNRYTAPDVRRGERVLVWQVGDSPTYYWQALGRDDHLRRLETVIWTFNANPNNDDKEPSDKDTWTMEINTHDGHATFRTTMMNSEKCRWTTQYNMAEGYFSHEDEKGNIVYIDSVNTDMMFQNADKSYIQLIKDTINLETKTWNAKIDEFNIKAKDINIETDTMDIRCSDSLLGTIGGELGISAGNIKVSGPVTFNDFVRFASGLKTSSLSVAGVPSDPPSTPDIPGIEESESRMRAKAAVAKTFGNDFLGTVEGDMLVENMTVKGTMKADALVANTSNVKSRSGGKI